MNNREAMKMALDCLLAFEKEDYFRWSKEDNACVVALRAALAQPEPEPVAWRSSNWGHSDDDYIYRDLDDPALLSNGEVSPSNEPLYTSPPKREWVGLTDEEIKTCAKGGRSIGISFHDAICRAEAKLKEKNT